MSNAQKVKETSMDAYAHQKVYEEKKAEKKVLVSWIFLAISIVSLVSVFIFPMYKYKYTNRDTGFSISGKFTSVKMISKYFSNGFGDYALLNTITMLSVVLIIVAIIYIVIGAAVSIFLKGKMSGLLRKATNYTTLELVATLQFVLLIINMIAAKIDVSGSVTNLIGFWIISATTILLVCVSISLSTPTQTSK